MAVRKFILVTGQSNATEEPPAQSWEDENPYLSLRSPQHVATKTPQFANGAYNDLITLPYTFNGGQQTGILGDGARSDSWQYVNVLGTASQALRYLTFYDPSASYFNSLAVTNTYPGTGRILEGSTSSSIKTSVSWQEDPSGIKITRQRTGQTHTINSTDTGATVTLDTPMLPAPEVGELFTYEVETCVPTDGQHSASQLAFKNTFGGISFFPSQETNLGKYTSYISDIRDSSGNALPMRVNCRSRLFQVGDAVTFENGAVGTVTYVGGVVAGAAGQKYVTRVGTPLETRDVANGDWDYTNNRINLSGHQLGDREPITFTPKADNTLPTEIEQGRTYYTATFDRNIDIPYTAWGAGLTALDPSAPNTAWETFDFTITITGHGLIDGDIVRFAAGGDFPTDDALVLPAADPALTPPVASTLYYVKRIDDDTFELYTDANLTGQDKTVSWDTVPTDGSVTLERITGNVTHNSFQIVKDTLTWTPDKYQAGTGDPVVYNIQITNHGLQNGEQVYFASGSNLPAADTSNEDVVAAQVDTTYYVFRVDADNFRLYTQPDYGLATLGGVQVGWDLTTTPSGGSTLRPRTFFAWDEKLAITAPASGTTSCTITRLDSYSDFYISDTLGGEELDSDGQSGRSPLVSLEGRQFANELLTVPTAIFRGSLTGLQARCISGESQNEGEARALNDIELAGTPPITYVNCDAFPVTPAAGDTFVIEPQNQVAEFHKWAMWLPWCPFEGKAQYDGPGLVAWLINSGGKNLFFSVAGLKAPVEVGMKVRLYTDGALPASLVAGRDYFVAEVTSLPGLFGVYGIELKANYDDTAKIAYSEDDFIDPAYFGVTTMFVVDQAGKGNPFPPGFNYPNHYATPRPYQPFDGPMFMAKQPSAAFHTSLGYKFYEHYGEVFNIALSAIGQSSVGHKEVRDVSTILTGHSWYDRMQFKSWSPGEPNNCFSRVLDTLDAAKTAFEAEGDTGECVGIFYAQGETDAFLPRLADNYENAMRKLKAAMRQAVKERGLTSLDEDKIPFIHPQIKNYDIYPGTEVVNAAITALADEDPYSRTVSVDGVDLLPNDVHYTGKGMSLLGDRCYEAWKDIQRSGSSEVDICNLALTNIGDKATVTSINPSDGSHQADLCARYYPLARDLLLERHRWDFTIRHVSPVALTASGRTDWAYAFKLPSNFTGVISVLPKDSTDDQITQGTASPQPFAIESNASLDRVLYTNEPEVILRYQAKVTDSTKFSQMFVHAVSWQLASMLAGALIKGDDGAAAVQNATRMAEFYTEKAAAYDSRSTREKPVVDGNINPWDR